MIRNLHPLTHNLGREEEKAKRYDIRRKPKRLKGVQYATGKEQRANTNRSSKNARPKWK